MRLQRQRHLAAVAVQKVIRQIAILLLTLSYVQVMTFQQQGFKVIPTDTNIGLGENVTLNCTVDDITGYVQWTKDGFGLGYDSAIPGHPRHTMTVDKKKGVYDLIITNVTDADDALYQCQVSPGTIDGGKPIRASARLLVLTPPDSVEITNASEDMILEVRENEEITIECVSRNSKPATSIIWFRSNTEIKPENRSDNVTENTNTKLFAVRSQIKVTVTAEDDRVKYTCEVHHEALINPLSTTVQIRVLYPPGVPHIEGYTEGDIFEKGQQVNLRCVSKVGNPPAQLSWFRNDQIIQNEYKTTEKVSESTYSFIANASDNNAKYRCEAKNSISPLPQYAEVVLSVSYGPSHVRIKGPTEGKQGDVVKLNCETSHSNPASTIKWSVPGEPEKNSTSSVVATPQASWITKSNLSFAIPHGQSYVEVTCQAITNGPFEKVIAAHRINVLYPPGAPIIIDYSSGNPIPSGNTVRSSCLSTGGHPLGTIAWFKNDEEIQSTITVSENSVSAELSFAVNYTDNDAVLKCEVTHPALNVPLVKTQKLNILYLPDHLIIKHDPEHLRAGSLATLTCETSSGNPASKMSWWLQGIPVTEGINSFSKPGLYGGKLSTIQVTINVTSDVDGSVYICKATNTPLLKNLHKDVTLYVYHKPTFDSHPNSITVNEGENVFVKLQAKGRPSHITYKWFKNGEPLYPLNGRHMKDSEMNITGVYRGDAGNYTCEASNSEGPTTFWIVVLVNYKPTVINTSVGVVVSEGSNAQLWCQFDGFPLGADHVSWTRPDFTLNKRAKILLKNNISYITIVNTTKTDSGYFYCVINNGVGNESSRSVLLIVKHKPEIIATENQSKTASNAGMLAKLRCRALGAPAIKFFWEREGSAVSNTTNKYIVEEKKLNETMYESTLKILQVNENDFGDYRCTASNDLGRATAIKRLTVFSHPDPPVNFRLINITHNKVILAWSPGFDGGEPVTYRIRYRASNKQKYRYEDLGNETEHTVTGLDPSVTYLFSIMARNMYGDSSYVSESLKVTTKSESEQSKPSDAKNKSAEHEQKLSILIVFLGVLIGGLIVVTIMSVFYCIHRRRDVSKQMDSNDSSNDSSSKTPTIEMYAPNTYSGGYEENMSSISAKSETYSNVSPDYNDDQQPNHVQQKSYVIEQIDYPFISECQQHPLQQPIAQYGGDSISSDYPIIQHHQHQYQQHQPPQQQQQMHYVPENPQHDRRNIENREFHLQQPSGMPPSGRSVPLPLVLHNRPPAVIPPPMVKYNYYSPPPPPPPDVTVFSSQNFLTTFAHKADETEGHLV